jgi:2-polyprenyl-3-methyl-5-hydroxy-6-metoxy-1,4-benzoquinol methylase
MITQAPLRLIRALLSAWQWHTLNRSESIRKRIEVISSMSPERLADCLGNGERGFPSSAMWPNGWWRHMLLRYGQALTCSRDKVVLDLACGIGWGSYLLNNNARNVCGLDIREDVLNRATTLWPDKSIHWVCGSCLNIPFSENTFSVITAVECLEHFTYEDSDAVLREVRRCLQPGGTFIGSTPSPWRETDAKEAEKQNPYHLHVYSRTRLYEHLSKYFRDVSISPNSSHFRART